MPRILSHYLRIEKPILYIIIAEFFVQLVNVTFMNVQPVYMQAANYSKDQIPQFMAFRFLGVLLLALPLGYYIIGKKVKRLFLLAAILVPAFGMMIVYSIETKNFSLLYISQILWGASFTFIQIPIIPFLMRNSRKENHTAGIALSYATYSFAGILSGILVYAMQAINPIFFDEKTVLIVVSLCALAGLYFIMYARLDERIIIKKTGSLSKKNYDWNIIIKSLMPTLFLAVGAGFTIPLISYFFSEVHGLDIGEFAPVSTAAAILVAWAAIMVPNIKRKIGYKIAIPVTQSVAVVALAAMATTELFKHLPMSVVIAVVFYLLRQPLMNVAGPMTTEVVMNYVGRNNREMVSTLTSAIWSGSWFLSLLLAAGIFNLGYSFVNLFLLTAALYAIAIGWYIWLLNDYRKREEMGLIERDEDEAAHQGH